MTVRSSKYGSSVLPIKTCVRRVISMQIRLMHEGLDISEALRTYSSKLVHSMQRMLILASNMARMQTPKDSTPPASSTIPKDITSQKQHQADLVSLASRDKDILEPKIQVNRQGIPYKLMELARWIMNSSSLHRPSSSQLTGVNFNKFNPRLRPH
jgi:hypothetical protein